MASQYKIRQWSEKFTMTTFKGRDISSTTLLYWSMAAALACLAVNQFNLSL